MIRHCKPKWIERKKYESLSSSSKKFGSAKTYKGRGALAPCPPFVGCSATHNCSFQSILACRGESYNYILGTFDFLKDYFLHVFYVSHTAKIQFSEAICDKGCFIVREARKHYLLPFQKLAVQS